METGRPMLEMQRARMGGVRPIQAGAQYLPLVREDRAEQRTSRRTGETCATLRGVQLRARRKRQAARGVQAMPDGCGLGSQCGAEMPVRHQHRASVEERAILR